MEAALIRWNAKTDDIEHGRRILSDPHKSQCTRLGNGLDITVPLPSGALYIRVDEHRAMQSEPRTGSRRLVTATDYRITVTRNGNSRVVTTQNRGVAWDFIHDTVAREWRKEGNAE